MTTIISSTTNGLFTHIITSNDEVFTIYNSPTKGFCVADGETYHDINKITSTHTLDEALNFIINY